MRPALSLSENEPASDLMKENVCAVPRMRQCTQAFGVTFTVLHVFSSSSQRGG